MVCHFYVWIIHDTFVQDMVTRYLIHLAGGKHIQLTPAQNNQLKSAEGAIKTN